MKTMTGSTQRANRHHQSGGLFESGWQKKADHQRIGQERAYHHQANKEIVQRVIAKVSALDDFSYEHKVYSI